MSQNTVIDIVLPVDLPNLPPNNANKLFVLMK